MSRIVGTDISHYQGEVNFAKMKENAEFCFIKATQNYKDVNFDQNWAGAKEAGLRRGAYHLIELTKNISDQVFLYLSSVIFEEGDLPPVLDVEADKIEEVGDPSVASARILDWLFSAEQLTGCTPILYISPRGVSKLEGFTEGLNKYTLWDVDYENPEPGLTKQPELPQTFTSWSFWQWTSEGEGALYGAESDHIDLDYFNGCIHTFEEYVNMNTPTNPWNIDVEDAQKYNDSRNYDDPTISGIISFVAGNFWYEEDIINKIAYWQYNNSLDVDGKVGPTTLQAMIDAGLEV